MSEAIFKDFDAAVSEEEGETLVGFQYGGETFENIDINVEAGKILLWMRGGQTMEAVPEMLVLFLGEDEFTRLCATGARRNKMLELVKWMAGLMGDDGGSGN